MARHADGNSAVKIDSRKFLGTINDSFQARVAMMEGRVRELGRRGGMDWRLVSMNSDTLFIEDAGNGTYYNASYRREKRGGGTVIENIKQLKVIESKKRSLFEASCKQLVDAIESNDQRDMAVAFNKMASQRFSSRTVPFSGTVRTRDGITRTVTLSSDAVVDEDVRPRLVAAIVESLTNQFIIKEGRPVSGSFTGRRIRLPVSEWLCRKSVARRMRTVAEQAYWSKGFQDRIYDVASLINDDKVGEAVQLISGFLAENQEFTTLGRERSKRLIENALATKACFNQQLCNDTATLFWRTNLKVNRDAIIKEWGITARKASHPTLLENVNILGRSPNFEAAYDRFIGFVFNEAVGPRDVQVNAYKTALKALKETPRIKESDDLSGKIGELIERLDQPETDHAVIAEVEDLLAEVQTEMGALESLDNFDEVPGGAGGTDDSDPLGAGLGGDEEEAGGASGGKGGKGGTTVNFNININGDGEVDTGGMGGDEGGEDDDLAALLGDEGGEEAGGDEGGEDDDLAALLGGGGDEAGGEEAGGEDDLAALLSGESRGRGRTPINEDDYAYRPTKKAGGMGADYGAAPIEVAEDCAVAVKAMLRLAEHHRIGGSALLERVQELAVAGMKSAGVIIPENRKDRAVEQVCDAFFDELDRRGIELDEDQYKGPWRHVWGRKKASLARQERKKGSGGTKSESREAPRPAGRRRAPSIEWIEEEANAKLGTVSGVSFVFDHAQGQDDPVILSEDGQIEVPVPTGLRASAYAAADMGDGDPAPFINWLAENVEQLRSESDPDVDAAISEAQISIKTNPDGSVDLEVDSADPSVNMTDPMDDPMGDMGDDPMGDMGDDPMGDMGDDPMGDEFAVAGADGEMDPADDGMEPVDTMVPMGGDEGGDDLDFEGGDIAGGPPDMGDMGDDDGGDGPPDMGDDDGGDEGDDEGGSPPPPKKPKGDEGGKKPPKKPAKKSKDDDEGVAEDRDITSPQTRKYGSHKDDHRKDVPVPKPGESGSKLDGLGDGPVDTPGAKMKKVTQKGGKKK